MTHKVSDSTGKGFAPLNQAMTGNSSMVVTAYGINPPGMDGWPDPNLPSSWPMTPSPSPPKPERVFRCAKCESTTVDVHYQESSKKLKCKCLRCKHTWVETPSDAPKEQGK